MSSTKRDRTGKRSWKTGQVVRDEKSTEVFEVGSALSDRRPTPASAWDLSLLADRDYQYARALRTSGWKNSRCRRQW